MAPATVTAIEVYHDPGVAQLANAAVAGDTAKIQTLIRDGVDVNAIGDHDFSLLHWALVNGGMKGVLAMLDAGANPALADDRGQTIMHVAARMTDPAPLNVLIKAGVSTELKNPLDGRTPIFSAIMGDREPQFDALVAAGANLNAQDLKGYTPLHDAAMAGDYDFVLKLLEAGASPSVLDSYGGTFQSYLNITNESIMTKEALDQKKQIQDWLVAHGFELEKPRK